MTILDQGTRKKTRKPHRCVVCGVMIPAGSTCEWQTNNGGGEWDFGTVYWHPECEDGLGEEP